MMEDKIKPNAVAWRYRGRRTVTVSKRRRLPVVLQYMVAYSTRGRDTIKCALYENKQLRNTVFCSIWEPTKCGARYKQLLY